MTTEATEHVGGLRHQTPWADLTDTDRQDGQRGALINTVQGFGNIGYTKKIPMESAGFHHFYALF